jgi:transcriptional regulator with XRE-family HTH domain
VRIEPEQYRLVGARLAAARRRANLTQTEAAERLGRNQTFVSEIERGLRRVDVLERCISFADDTRRRKCISVAAYKIQVAPVAGIYSVPALQSTLFRADKEMTVRPPEPLPRQFDVGADVRDFCHRS